MNNLRIWVSPDECWEGSRPKTPFVRGPQDFGSSGGKKYENIRSRATGGRGDRGHGGTPNVAHASIRSKNTQAVFEGSSFCKEKLDQIG